MKYNAALYPFESKWIKLNNDQIHYIDEGTGQVILFSHAAIGSSFMYRRFVQILGKHFRCIALDFPGFGISQHDSQKQYSIVSQADLLGKFIKGLGLQDIIAFGHDTGGPSIINVAVRYPDIFKGLILTDTIMFPTTEYQKIHKMLRVVGSTPFEWLNSRTNFLTKLTLNKGVTSRRLLKEEKHEYFKMTFDSNRRNNITSVLSSLRQNPDFMNAIKNGLENQLNQKPTLLIYGENDPVNILGIPERIHKMMTNSELFLINSESHFPHEGQPERMSEIIFEWINNLNT
ncbi:alpha/beta fold hydrolase [Ekhidna sp.]|uniref:alpha/beta fold hydrolase n=1 Tax=Ekhidna sp. TaxID=2608089 RepID=UPI003297A6D5